MKNKLLILFIMANTLAGTRLAYSQSGPEYRRSSIMRGNQVKTVFGNWGVIGQPAEKGHRGAWIYDNNGYIGDVSLMVGAEVTVDGKTFHSVVVSPVNRPARQHEISPEGRHWGFEPVGGYFNEAHSGVALYSDPSSWPPYWPDKMNNSEDPGWPGAWNGFFGKTTTASEEAYFVMDDNNDKEFNYAENNRWGVAFKPDETNVLRDGLGLEVRVRAMQWSDFLAQDCIIWLYEIKNTGTYDYSKVVFGLLAGTYVGVSSTEDYGEYDDDYSFFDVAKDMVYTADFNNYVRNPLWTGDVGVVGYAFLESPGNPYDGIDNDGDADTHPTIPATGPFFTPESFQPRILNAGDPVVLIDDDYNRTVITVPPRDTTLYTRGAFIDIVPGVTELTEGNVIIVNGEEIVNPNAYDGIDNDLDGLIDENYYLHYRQIRRDQKGNILIDRLRPVRHKCWVSGLGVNDLLIDERRDDGIDNSGTWNPLYDDVGADGIPGTGDFGEGDGIPTPGEPNFDKTDPTESDQIGLTSFEYFAPAVNINLADDEELWNRMRPGYFKVPESIVNNRPERGEDGDFIFGSGYFPLRAGQTERISLALVYGHGGGPNMDLDHLLKNRETVQKIYNSGYRFPPPPDRPTLVAVPGDGQVTLYWDRAAERSFDPVLREYDFEGYKIYKATDHNFNDVFNITDASGTKISYQPIAQFDLENDISGYFRPGEDLFQMSQGASFYLGDNTGLRHSYVDTDVENGKRYFYAVAAYDRGDAVMDIFPKENDKRIDISASGEVRTYKNTAVVIPNAPVAGYQPPEGSVLLDPIEVIGTGSIYKKVVDAEALTGAAYRLEFLDTSNDGTEEENAQKTPEEYFIPVTTSYTVRNLTGFSEVFSARDTLAVLLKHENIIPSTFILTDSQGNPVDSSRYQLDYERGRIRANRPKDLLFGASYTAEYEYYPVYKSTFIEGNPNETETRDTDIFDGIWLSFDNHWQVTLDAKSSHWSNPDKSYNFNFYIIDAVFGTDRIRGLRRPADYQIIFHDEIVDTSHADPAMFINAIPVNFRIFNVTDNAFAEFIFNDLNRDQKLSPFDELIFLENDKYGNQLISWAVNFTSLTGTTHTFGSGDTLFINTRKPFRSGDVFEFTTKPPKADRTIAKEMLDQIKVVPNPYVVATSHELPLPPAVTSGRGERKMDFIHLPSNSKIHIFTSRGDHVITLNHDSNIHDGTVSWNLKTKENLDIAAGVYFYVVESDAGTKRGRIGIIK